MGPSCGVLALGTAITLWRAALVHALAGDAPCPVLVLRPVLARRERDAATPGPTVLRSPA